MTNYRQIERDFIQRTQAIIEQYEQYADTALPAEDTYEVTLLLNCLLGMLIFPQQIAAQNRGSKSWSDWLTQEKIYQIGSEWGIQPESVKNPGTRNPNNREKKKAEEVGEQAKPVKITVEELTVRNLIRQMRNAAAHANFALVPSLDGNIKGIRFGDKRDGFCLELEVSALKMFVTHLTTSALEKIP